jgi:hypothetical protein
LKYLRLILRNKEHYSKKKFKELSSLTDKLKRCFDKGMKVLRYERFNFYITLTLTLYRKFDHTIQNFEANEFVAGNLNYGDDADVVADNLDLMKGSNSNTQYNDQDDNEVNIIHDPNVNRKSNHIKTK